MHPTARHGHRPPLVQVRCLITLWVFFWAAELCPSEDAGDHVPVLSGRDVPELQRGPPAALPEDHPDLRRGGPRAQGHALPGAGREAPPRDGPVGVTSDGFHDSFAVTHGMHGSLLSLRLGSSRVLKRSCGRQSTRNIRTKFLSAEEPIHVGNQDVVAQAGPSPPLC